MPASCSGDEWVFRWQQVLATAWSPLPRDKNRRARVTSRRELFEERDQLPQARQVVEQVAGTGAARWVSCGAGCTYNCRVLGCDHRCGFGWQWIAEKEWRGCGLSDKVVECQVLRRG